MLIAYGRFLFRYRNVLFPAVLFLLLVIFDPRPFAANINLDRWLDLAGILVILTGQIIRAGVIGLAYIKRGGVNKQIHADALVTKGIFAHCRNPLYLGNLAILGGFLIIHNSPWIYSLGGGFFLLSYVAIVAAEEAWLHQKFGSEYEKYCSKTNRWMIDLSGIATTLGSMSFNWKRVLAKDYTTFLTWFLTVSIILLREQIAFYGIEYSVPYLAHAGIVITPVLILALWVRISKKNGRLAR